MAFDRYPAVNEDENFPEEVRDRFASDSIIFTTPSGMVAGYGVQVSNVLNVAPVSSWA